MTGMKINRKWKREKYFYLIMIIVCLVAIVAGIAYAYIAYYARQKGINVIESECIKIEMEEVTGAINLVGAYPIRNESVEKLKPFTFKLTNTCSMSVEYSINLEVLDIEERMPSNNVGVKLDEEEIKVLTSEIETEIKETEEYEAVESYKIGNGSLKPQESKSHSIKVWLHESAGNESQNKSFYSKVVVSASPTLQAIWNFNDYIISLSKSLDRGVEKVSHGATSQTGALIDYRYVGKNPDNYVCFGSEVNPCPSSNLYRIIGVIPTQSGANGTYENRVKLIKNSYYTESSSGLLTATNAQFPAPGGYGYLWCPNGRNNNWGVSTLQSRVLNGIYWNSLGTYQRYITSSVWYLGGLASENHAQYTADTLYARERGSIGAGSGGSIVFAANIGLMYPSDYVYSMGSSYRSTLVNSIAGSLKTSAWLYSLEGKYFEWTISPSYGSTNTSRITDTGHVYAWVCNDSRVYEGIRPTFYLKANVLYSSGDGTISNPYRISI